MKIIDTVQALSGSAHTGRALKAARILNLVGTVRGAVTTVLLASSAIGGAVTVNSVRQDIAKDQPAATQAARAITRTTPPPTPTPLTAAGLRSDADKRLQTQLAANAQAAEDLRKVTVLNASAIDALVLQTRQKLQARYELAMSQIDELLKPVPSPSASAGLAGAAPPQPTASLSIVGVNALVQVALGDMGGIVFVATRTATTEPPPIQIARPTIAPTPVPTIARTPTPVPTPVRTPSPTVKPTPTP